MYITLSVLFLLFTVFYTTILGKVVEDHIVTTEKWKFLDRFCFLSMDGLFKYEIEYDSTQGTPSLLMYPDLQWADAYQNENARTCQAKNDVLDRRKFQLIELSTDSLESGCENVYLPRFGRRGSKGNITLQNHTNTIICKNTRSFATARERWWFIAISNCNGTTGLDIKYKFRMTNGKHGDYWYEHFSADEFYILPVLTSFCFTYLFLLFTALIFAVELKCRQLFHITYKLFLTSLLFQNIGIIMLCIAYGRYASNGTSLTAVKLIGRIFEALCEFFFILLLLLLAKGFTVTRGRLRLASAVKLTIFICTYFVLYGLLFAFEQYFFDPALVLYIYESPAGYGILVLRLIGWLMFVYAIFFTLKHYPEKASFYIPFFIIYSLWFISGPVVIIISNHVIDKWVREKVSVSVEHVCMFVGHVVFLCLTRPSAANKSFPYHVRTTQVGADLTASTQPLDRFDSHSYAPSYIDGTGRTVDIFTVRGVLQRVDGTPNGPSSPMDVFSANGGAAGWEHPQIPALFPLPPPKYADVFPHEEPGQVAEMLKEPEFYDSDEEYSEDGDGSERPARGEAAAVAAPTENADANNTRVPPMSNGVGHYPRENVYSIS